MQREPQHRSKSKNSSLLLFLFSLLLFFLSSLLLDRHHGQGATAMEMDSPLKDPPMGGVQEKASKRRPPRGGLQEEASKGSDIDSFQGKG